MATRQKREAVQRSTEKRNKAHQRHVLASNHWQAQSASERMGAILCWRQRKHLHRYGQVAADEIAEHSEKTAETQRTRSRKRPPTIPHRLLRGPRANLPDCLSPDKASQPRMRRSAT